MSTSRKFKTFGKFVEEEKFKPKSRNRMQQIVQQMQQEIFASHVTLMVLTIALA
jgi:ABC-type polysaccharide/polyol phosphate transport system ATPase subunit